MDVSTAIRHYLRIRLAFRQIAAGIGVQGHGAVDKAGSAAIQALSARFYPGTP